MRALDLIERLTWRGAAFSIEGESGTAQSAQRARLRVDAPAGVLSPEIRAALSGSRLEVMALLAEEVAAWDGAAAVALLGETLEAIDRAHGAAGYAQPDFRQFDWAAAAAFRTHSLKVVKAICQAYERAVALRRAAAARARPGDPPAARAAAGGERR